MDELNVRIWEIIDKCRDAVFITNTSEGYPRARTMNMLLDNDHAAGVLFFATQKSSRKVKEIEENNNVSVFFADKTKLDHVDIFGKAEIHEDKEIKLRFWDEKWKEYWPGGPESDDYVIIKVLPEKGEFFFNDEIKQGTIQFNKSY